MFCVIFMMLFAVVLSRECGICEIDAHLSCNINVLDLILFGTGEAHIGIFVLRHCSPDYLMAMSQRRLANKRGKQMRRDPLS